MQFAFSPIINRIKTEAREFLKFSRYTVERYIEDHCVDAAAGLTYTTLFSIVPLLTVSIGVIAVVPVFAPWVEGAQEFLLAHIVPSSSEVVEGALVQFSQTAKNLTGLSLILLFVTVLLLLNTIETSFNRIWGIRTKRPLSIRLLLYWALITLGPLLFAAFAAASVSLETELMGNVVETPLYRFLVSLVPQITGIIFFMILFGLVPNCLVPLKHAFIGALVTVMALSIAENMFSVSQLGASYSKVYGAFAALPVFLVWLYVSWVIILFGANLTRCLPHYRLRRQSAYSRMLVAISVLRWLWQRREEGGYIDESAWIKGKLKDLPAEAHSDWLILRERLASANLIVMTDKSEIAMGRDLSQFSQKDFLLIIDRNFLLNLSRASTADRLPPALVATLDKLTDEADERLSKPLSEWLE